MEGYLYCLFNVMFLYYGKDVYKLGCCINVKNRLKGYITSYISDSEIKYTSEKIIDIYLAETILFNKLEKYRMIHNREFFNCKLEIIIKTINEVENIMKHIPIESLKKEYSSKTNREIIECIKKVNDINEITENNNIYEIKRYILRKKLKLDVLTNEIIESWYKKEYILNNILYVFNKKEENDNYKEEINYEEKKKYLLDILNLFGFKGLNDFDTKIELNDEIRKKIMDYEPVKIYTEYEKMMGIFHKRKRTNKIYNFEFGKNITILSCILNEFGIKLESKRKHTRSIDTYIYYIKENMIKLREILHKYDIY